MDAEWRKCTTYLQIQGGLPWHERPFDLHHIACAGQMIPPLTLATPHLPVTKLDKAKRAKTGEGMRICNGHINTKIYSRIITTAVSYVSTWRRQWHEAGQKPMAIACHQGKSKRRWTGLEGWRRACRAGKIMATIEQ